MKVQRTDLLNANIRRETIPDITEEQYEALIFEESVASVEVSETTAEYLIQYHYASEVQ